MKMCKYTSNTNILYLNYTSSSIESGFYQSSVVPDSFSSIIKNNTIIIDKNINVSKETLPPYKD